MRSAQGPDSSGVLVKRALMDQKKITAVSALCKFDVLLCRIALESGGYPSQQQKRELDEALAMRERVCKQFGLPPSQQHS